MILKKNKKILKWNLIIYYIFFREEDIVWSHKWLWALIGIFKLYNIKFKYEKKK